MKKMLNKPSVQIALIVIGMAVVAAGCMQPVKPGVSTTRSTVFNAKPVTDGPLESNIVRVNKFFSSEPWLSFESDGTNKPDGVKFSVYLEGPIKPQGVFGTGRMVVTMYRIDFNPVGEEVTTQVYEWDLPADRAYDYRSKELTALGWGYGLRLQWDRQLDLSGKQVAFLVKYIREDGKVITSSRQVLKLPKIGSAGIEPHKAVATNAKPTVTKARPRAAPVSQVNTVKSE